VAKRNNIIRIDQASDFYCASPQVAVISGSSYTNQRLAEISNWNDWTDYNNSGYTPGRFAVNKLFNNEACLIMISARHDAEPW